MARRGLSDIAIRNFKPGTVRREIPDPGARGLYVVVHPTGRKGFAVRYRFYGVPRKLTLKGGISLVAARKLAAEAMHEVAAGRDPSVTRQEAKARAADTLQSVCEEYFKREGAGLRTVEKQRSTLTRLVFKSLGARPIGSIRRKEILRLLDKIADENGPRMADLVLAAAPRHELACGPRRRFPLPDRARDEPRQDEGTGAHPHPE